MGLFWISRTDRSPPWSSLYFTTLEGLGRNEDPGSLYSMLINFRMRRIYSKKGPNNDPCHTYSILERACHDP